MNLYHCTTCLNKDLILQDGLKIEKSLSNNKIFLSKNPEYCYGNTCFIVNIEGLDIKQTVNSWEFTYDKSIRPNRIKYHGFKEID